MSTEQLEKLRQLRLKMNEARQKNHVAVVEEDRLEKQPKNWHFREDKRKRKIDETNAKKICLSKGVDYEKIKMLEVGADVLDHVETRNMRKIKDTGFSNFAQATERSYKRNVANMRPDLKAGPAAYPDLYSLPVSSIVKDSDDAINNMVKDLDKQIEKRSKYHRRRRHDPDDTVDYINERNRLLNKKMDYFYGRYTKDTKDDLERGTAL